MKTTFLRLISLIPAWVTYFPVGKTGKIQGEFDNDHKYDNFIVAHL